MNFRLDNFCAVPKAYSYVSFYYQNAHMYGASVVAQAAIQETQALSLDQEDPLEKGMATHSSIFAWSILWAEEPDWLQPIGSQRVGQDPVTNTFTFHRDHLKVQDSK